MHWNGLTTPLTERRRPLTVKVNTVNIITRGHIKRNIQIQGAAMYSSRERAVQYPGRPESVPAEPPTSTRQYYAIIREKTAINSKSKYSQYYNKRPKQQQPPAIWRLAGAAVHRWVVLNSQDKRRRSPPRQIGEGDIQVVTSFLFVVQSSG